MTLSYKWTLPPSSRSTRSRSSIISCVLGTAKHLGINYITDDRLIFAGKIFVRLVGSCSHWFILPAERDLAAVRYAAAQDWVSTSSDHLAANRLQLKPRAILAARDDR
jgi:hypothetical protein